MFPLNIIRFLRGRISYWNIVHDLSRLNDRELSDVGIHRADIQNIALLAAKKRDR